MNTVKKIESTTLSDLETIKIPNINLNIVEALANLLIHNQLMPVTDLNFNYHFIQGDETKYKGLLGYKKDLVGLETKALNSLPSELRISHIRTKNKLNQIGGKLDITKLKTADQKSIKDFFPHIIARPIDASLMGPLNKSIDDSFILTNKANHTDIITKKGQISDNSPTRTNPTPITEKYKAIYSNWLNTSEEVAKKYLRYTTEYDYIKVLLNDLTNWQHLFEDFSPAFSSDYPKFKQIKKLLIQLIIKLDQFAFPSRGENFDNYLSKVKAYLINNTTPGNEVHEIHQLLKSADQPTFKKNVSAFFQLYTTGLLGTPATMGPLTDEKDVKERIKAIEEATEAMKKSLSSLVIKEGKIDTKIVANGTKLTNLKAAQLNKETKEAKEAEEAEKSEKKKRYYVFAGGTADAIGEFFGLWAGGKKLSWLMAAGPVAKFLQYFASFLEDFPNPCSMAIGVILEGCSGFLSGLSQGVESPEMQKLEKISNTLTDIQTAIDKLPAKIDLKLKLQDIHDSINTIFSTTISDYEKNIQAIHLQNYDCSSNAITNLTYLLSSDNYNSIEDKINGLISDTTGCANLEAFLKMYESDILTLTADCYLKKYLDYLNKGGKISDGKHTFTEVASSIELILNLSVRTINALQKLRTKTAYTLAKVHVQIGLSSTSGQGGLDNQQKIKLFIQDQFINVYNDPSKTLSLDLTQVQTELATAMQWVRNSILGRAGAGIKNSGKLNEIFDNLNIYSDGFLAPKIIIDGLYYNPTYYLDKMDDNPFRSRQPTYIQEHTGELKSLKSARSSGTWNVPTYKLRAQFKSPVEGWKIRFVDKERTIIVISSVENNIGLIGITNYVDYDSFETSEDGYQGFVCGLVLNAVPSIFFQWKITPIAIKNNRIGYRLMNVGFTKASGFPNDFTLSEFITMSPFELPIAEMEAAHFAVNTRFYAYEEKIFLPNHKYYNADFSFYFVFILKKGIVARCSANDYEVWDYPLDKKATQLKFSKDGELIIELDGNNWVQVDRTTQYTSSASYLLFDNSSLYINYVDGNLVWHPEAQIGITSFFYDKSDPSNNSKWGIIQNTTGALTNSEEYYAPNKDYYLKFDGSYFIIYGRNKEGGNDYVPYFSSKSWYSYDWANYTGPCELYLNDHGQLQVRMKIDYNYYNIYTFNKGTTSAITPVLLWNKEGQLEIRDDADGALIWRLDYFHEGWGYESPKISPNWVIDAACYCDPDGADKEKMMILFSKDQCYINDIKNNKGAFTKAFIKDVFEGIPIGKRLDAAVYMIDHSDATKSNIYLFQGDKYWEYDPQNSTKTTLNKLGKKFTLQKTGTISTKWNLSNFDSMTAALYHPYDDDLYFFKDNKSWNPAGFGKNNSGVEPSPNTSSWSKLDSKPNAAFFHRGDGVYYILNGSTFQFWGAGISKVMSGEHLITNLNW